MTNYEKVLEFHQEFDLARPSIPEIPKDMLLRVRLIAEEFAEVLKAATNGDIVNLAKELADLEYVVQGTYVACGLPGDELLSAVHESNMSKSRERDVGGKIQKGDSYVEPDIVSVLDEYIRKRS